MHLRREYGMEMRADIDLGKDIKAANYSIRNKCKLHSPPPLQYSGERGWSQWRPKTLERKKSAKQEFSN